MTKFAGPPAKVAWILASRLRRLFGLTDPSSPKVKAAMTRAAAIIVADAKLNVRAKLNRDSDGHLDNSIGYRFLSPFEVLIGSFGIPYARIHEYGGTITPKEAKALAIPIDPRFKGRRAKNVENLFRLKDILYQKRGKGLIAAFVLKKSVFIPPRPWLTPAFITRRKRVNEILNSIVE